MNVKVTPNMLRVLEVLAKHKELSASELAEKTGIKRGKRLKEMFESGLIKSTTYEGRVGMLHMITAVGKKALADSKKSAPPAKAEGKTKAKAKAPAAKKLKVVG